MAATLPQIRVGREVTRLPGLPSRWVIARSTHRNAQVATLLLPRRLLCQADGGGDAVGVFEEVVDAADELAFEAANRFLVGLASGTLFGDVDGGRRVVAELDDCEHVKGMVELSVAAGI
jgi:hypothetical protein